MKQILLHLLLILLLIPGMAQDNPLVKILKDHAVELGAVLMNPEEYRIQIIYTQIERKESGEVTFKDYEYRPTPDAYFYPASTVKMPVAFLALEYLNELRIKGLDAHTTMVTGQGSFPQTGVVTDSTAEDLLPSVDHYVKKIFLVSDNDAFNRLYELLGPCYINKKMREKGYLKSEIIHRLSAPNYTFETNMLTNPVSFHLDNQLLFHKGEVACTDLPRIDRGETSLGKAYVDEAGEIIQEPLYFGDKNLVDLHDLHEILKAFIFPNDIESPNRTFNINAEDRERVMEYLSMWPSTSTYPNYSDIPDNYVKFLFMGDGTYPAPEGLKIYNKVGLAYGFLSDIAYFHNPSEGIEFMLSAGIYVNENQTLNDGEYEYETLGFPFLSKLGKLVYDFEASR
jgi:hypothetical protein